ncbi:hypothetical protein TYRP_018146 [Tyrophagus putrescentiae]|nr:hypothetical protein TYRP_018146 [Tyrophagus putrescentiae]
MSAPAKEHLAGMRFWSRRVTFFVSAFFRFRVRFATVLVAVTAAAVAVTVPARRSIRLRLGLRRQLGHLLGGRRRCRLISEQLLHQRLPFRLHQIGLIDGKEFGVQFEATKVLLLILLMTVDSRRTISFRGSSSCGPLCGTGRHRLNISSPLQTSLHLHRVQIQLLIVGDVEADQIVLLDHLH